MLITFSTNLPEVDSFIIKDFNTVCSVVRDEDFLSIIDDDAIGELQVLGASKLVHDIASLIKNDHTHNFTFNYDDPPFVIDGHSARMLQNIGTKFANKLTVLVVNLNLKLV